MIRILSFLFFSLFLVSCSTVTQKVSVETSKSDDMIMNQAITDASVSGRNILETSKRMIEKQNIIVGGCWDYIDGVYNRSGVSAKERKTIFQSKFKGPYADTRLIEAGDWLYFVNHTYSDIEHSAIFIAWIDESKQEALMVNYVGGNQKKPGTYKRFILDNVYNIIRAE